MRSRSWALSTWPTVLSTERTMRSRSVAEVRDTPDSATSRPDGSSIGTGTASELVPALRIVLMLSMRVTHCSKGRVAFIRSVRVLPELANWPSGFCTIDSWAPS